ncbi:MAG: hypothetical protein HY936_06015 [Nitrosomonadales bacterium]|nr:hypothetical protein [Nitrosomonadales bacterium]
MKYLILTFALITIGVSFPIDVSAKIDSATLDRQRKENRARLEKGERLRAGKKERRIFKKSEAETKELRSLKLDAIPSSPRRTAKSTSENPEQRLPANPGRTPSTAKPERSPEALPAKRE